MSKEPDSSKPSGTKISRRSSERPDFTKAQGSSSGDQADMRDVARKAAKKSQCQNKPRGD
jgi:hypothetical protein